MPGSSRISNPRAQATQLRLCGLPIQSLAFEPGLETAEGAAGIPIAKTVYAELPVIEVKTWEYQDLLVDSIRRPKKAKKKTKRPECTTRVCAICGEADTIHAVLRFVLKSNSKQMKLN